MFNVKTTQPANDTWVVYCCVEKSTGHTTAGLGQWSTDLEAQLLDDSLDSYWVNGKAPALSRLKGAFESLCAELHLTRSREDQLEKRVLELESMINELQAVI